MTLPRPLATYSYLLLATEILLLMAHLVFFWIRAKGQGAGRPLTSVPKARHPNQTSCRAQAGFDTMLALAFFVLLLP